jgi:hypothetical protein
MILNQSSHASRNIKFLGSIAKEIMRDRILINVSDKINTKTCYINYGARMVEKTKNGIFPRNQKNNRICVGRRKVLERNCVWQLNKAT